MTQPTDENSWGLFLESWELFADSIYAGTLAGGLLGFLGVYIVIRRMVFLSAALSQTSSLGVALAYYAQLQFKMSKSLASPFMGATLTSLAVVVAFMVNQRRERIQQESLLGLFFLLGASGTLLVGTRIVQEIQDIQTLLFGTAVAVLREDLVSLGVLTVIVGGVHLWWRRGFTAVAMDSGDARVRKLPVGLLEILL